MLHEQLLVLEFSSQWKHSNTTKVPAEEGYTEYQMMAPRTSRGAQNSREGVKSCPLYEEPRRQMTVWDTECRRDVGLGKGQEVKSKNTQSSEVNSLSMWVMKCQKCHVNIIHLEQKKQWYM